MKNLVVVCVAVLFLVSCEKEIAVEQEEYLIFGLVTNGFCQRDCTTLFLLKSDKVYADDMSIFNEERDLKFKKEQLSNAKYEVAFTVKDQLPDELYDTNERRFGCPGCLDGPIIFIRYFDGADVYEWQVDTDKDSLSEYLGKYVDTVVEIVEELQR